MIPLITYTSYCTEGVASFRQLHTHLFVLKMKQRSYKLIYITLDRRYTNDPMIFFFFKFKSCFIGVTYLYNLDLVSYITYAIHRVVQKV